MTISYSRPDCFGIPAVGLRVVPAHVVFMRTVQPALRYRFDLASTQSVPILRADVVTVAILDRLIEHGHLITIDGPSYRAAEHSKLNTKARSASKRRGTKPRSKPRS